MAGRGNPSFLKRQKEQQRAARANAKRAAKQARRENRANGNEDFGSLEELIGPAGEQATLPEDDSGAPENPAH